MPNDVSAEGFVHETQMPAQMLVVDDDPRSRKLLEGYLRSEGYAVQSAPDGPTALAMVKRTVPDVVLLDVMMPVMTGYEVCQALKGSHLTRLSQVMLVTALDSTPDRVAGLDTGADDYVSKPVRREEFLAKTRALLRVRRLLVELEDARETLVSRNEELQLKKTLAQTLVHDLKNPLSAILGNLDLLEMRSGSELSYMVRRSKQGARRMLKMILNLLDVEGLEEGRMRPALDQVDVSQVVVKAVEEVELAALQRKVDLVVNAKQASFVQADAVLLRRVMDNLLSNAIAHSPLGGTVVVGVQRREEGIELSISDQGPGIPEEFREKVFEKYRQVDVRQAGVTANRGLGLTFCRLAVEAHGGTIWIEPAPGGGTIFRTLLPVSVDEPVPAVVPTA